MLRINVLTAVCLTFLLSGNTLIHTPAKQKITITSDEGTTIFVDEVEFGNGPIATGEAGSGYKQILIKKEGHKDHYAVMAEKTALIPAGEIIPHKTPDHKYMYCTRVNTKIDNNETKCFTLPYQPMGLMEAMEKDGGKEVTEPELLIPSYATDQLNDMLEKGGYNDTTVRFFPEVDNTLILEPKITKVHTFRIAIGNDYYRKVKMYLTWYIRDSYGDTLDSIATQAYSDDFYRTRIEKIIGDALVNSYLRIYNDLLSKHLVQQNDFTIKDPLLSVDTGKKVYVIDKTDAASACVMVKRKEGHGSGFAISDDGYILTTYNVAKTEDGDLKVITADGTELAAKLVRSNKYRDLSLIKIDYKFEKYFRVSSTKSFKNAQKAYTIGTPKSIELGQSISAGIISNERKANNNHLIQLSMSINKGNSGGPVFDDAGVLHGMIVAKLVGNNTEGVSFAIPGYRFQEYLNLEFK